MQVYVAHTYEIDDAKMAVEEIFNCLPSDILEQVKEKNAVGIVTTHADAIASGVLQALS